MFGGVASTWGQRYAEAVFQPACSSWLLCTGDDYIAEPGIPDVGEEQQKRGIKYQRIWEISSDMSGSFGCLRYRNSCRVLCESGFYGSFGENVKIVFAF